MNIVDVREVTAPIASSIANAYIDFSRMTLSLVAVVTDVVRDGRTVVGYGFNSNGRYGQGGLIRERFAPRLLEADPASLRDDAGANFDPDRIWATLMKNEKPGGHGERSVAVGTIDMAVWDAVAKIAGKPLFRLLAERHGRAADPKVFVYAAGGYYYPGKGIEQLRAEMRSYLDRGYTVVKMKIGNGIDEDRPRIEGVLKELDGKAQLAVDANGRLTLEQGIAYARDAAGLSPVLVRGNRRSARFRVAGGHGRVLPGADGDRREPVQPPGCAQPVALRRHAARSGLVAVRLRAVLRPVRVPADARMPEGGRMVAVALHSARRPPDVAQHRGRPGARRQRELSRSLPALRAASPTGSWSRTAISSCRSCPASASRARAT